jgi:hypothetical protein
LLAVAFLVLAFAQPYFLNKNNSVRAGGSAISIFVDNSFSMEAATTEGTLLDLSRDKARQIVSAFKPSDKYQLLTNDFDPEHQRFYTRDEFLDMLDRVTISPATKTFDELVNRQTDAFNTIQLPNKYSYYISDFQKSFFTNDPIESDSMVSHSFVKIASQEVPNIAIDSVWFTSPILQIKQPAELNVSLSGFALPDEQDVSVTLTVNDVQRAVASASINTSGTADVQLTFTPEVGGWYRAKVSIDDTPIRFDDEYFFSFYLAEQTNVMVILQDSLSPYLRALFKNKTFFNYSEAEYQAVNYSQFSKQDIIFLHQVKKISSGLITELKKYVVSGGSLVVIPDSASSIDDYKSLCSALNIESLRDWNESTGRIQNLNTEDILFEGVFGGSGKVDRRTDLPVVNGNFNINNRSDVARDELMSLSSGAPFLIRYPKSAGQVYLFTVPLSAEHSNFARHAIFVPVMFRLAVLSQSRLPMAYTLGANQFIETDISDVSGEKQLNLVNRDLEFDIIPGIRRKLNTVSIFTGDQPVVANLYRLMDSDSTILIIAYNYDRNESVMDFYDASEFEDYISSMQLKSVKVFDENKKNLAAAVNTDVEGVKMWKYCIILVLLFLLIETLLLKFFRT